MAGCACGVEAGFSGGKFAEWMNRAGGGCVKAGMDTHSHEVATSARTISLPVVLPKDLLDRVGVAAPCPAEWDEMVGDEKTRHCAMCKLNVHNLSAMGREEAEAFVRESVKVQADGGRVCVRFYRRADGTILTQDCPVGLAARVRRRVRAVVVAAMAIAGMTVAAVASGMGIGRSRWLATGSLGNAHPFSDVRKLIRGVPPVPTGVALMGDFRGSMIYVPPVAPVQPNGGGTLAPHTPAGGEP